MTVSFLLDPLLWENQYYRYQYDYKKDGEGRDDNSMAPILRGPPWRHVLNDRSLSHGVQS